MREAPVRIVDQIFKLLPANTPIPVTQKEKLPLSFIYQDDLYFTDEENDEPVRRVASVIVVPPTTDIFSFSGTCPFFVSTKGAPRP